MIHYGQAKLRALTKSLVGLAASVIVIGATITFESQSSHAGIQALTLAYAPMEPVIQTEPALPKPRPDPALAFDKQPVDIMLPRAKPALEDVLPISSATLAETIKTQTGHDTVSEMVYRLRAGEGVAAILLRAGYGAADTAAAIEAATSKASLRRLQIGMKFTIAEHGFRFSVKPGIDIYIVRHPDSGWIAINAIRPVQTYVAFIQGSIDDSSIGVWTPGYEAAFNEYVRVMGFSVDFQREVRRGDKFEMMYAIDRDCYQAM